MTTFTDGPLADAVRRAYAAGEEDELLEPIVRVDAEGRPSGRIGLGDSVVFYDVRGEQVVTIPRALTDPSFTLFPTDHDCLPLLHPGMAGCLCGVLSLNAEIPGGFRQTVHHRRV